jgi:hypothetical protein
VDRVHIGAMWSGQRIPVDPLIFKIFFLEGFVQGAVFGRHRAEIWPWTGGLRLGGRRFFAKGDTFFATEVPTGGF